MALVKFGMLIAEARGKLNGGVFSRGGGGNIIRTKVTPINPTTNAQQVVRGQFSSIAQGWRSLTDAQRAGWKSLSSNVTRSNIFGDNVVLSGIALYERVNRTRQSIAQAILTDAPALPTLNQLTALSMTMTAGTPAASVVFAPTPVPTGHTLVIGATPQMSPGRSFSKGRFVQIQTAAAASASPANILAAYTARFGTLVAGNKVTVKVHLVHIASGFATVPLTAIATVAA